MPAGWIAPMLPSRGQGVPFAPEAVAFELQWDGCSALLHPARDGRMRVWNRHGRERTAQWPELCGIADALAAREAYLDGKIVAFGPDGLPDLGIVAKLLNAPYTPGSRSPGWLKLKHPHARDLQAPAWRGR